MVDNHLAVWRLRHARFHDVERVKSLSQSSVLMGIPDFKFDSLI